MENWRPVVGFENYEVSDKGRVRNTGTGRVLRPGPHWQGYVMVTLYRDGQRHTRTVHRLVALAFIPNPENYPVVRHGDDVPDNNCVNNLLWGTQLDNMEDADKNGLLFHNSLHSVRIVETGEIFDSIGSCARYIGGSQPNISAVLNGRRRSVKGYTFELV
jgi:hypothetical protein